jgi:hypothetical protein
MELTINNMLNEKGETLTPHQQSAHDQIITLIQHAYPDLLDPRFHRLISLVAGEIVTEFAADDRLDELERLDLQDFLSLVVRRTRALLAELRAAILEQAERERDRINTELGFAIEPDSAEWDRW